MGVVVLFFTFCNIYGQNIQRGVLALHHFKVLREIEFRSHVHDHTAVENSPGCNHGDEPKKKKLTFVKSSQLPSVAK